MKRSQITLIALCLFVSSKYYAQFDTSFVHLTNNQFSVTNIYDAYSSQLTISTPKNSVNIKNANFKSRENHYVGLGFSFYRIGFSYSYLINFSNTPELKKDKAYNFIGGYSFKKFYGEMRIRKYNSFQKKKYEFNSNNIETELTVSDNKFFQIGAEFYYFTSKKYNFDASFKNYNIQKKSTVSPFINIGLDVYKIDAIYAVNNTFETRNIGKVVSYEVGGGLAGTLVYNFLYLAVLSDVGMAINHNSSTLRIKKEIAYNIEPYILLKASAGYNSNRVIATVSLIYDEEFIDFETEKIDIKNYYIGFKFGYKFGSKILGKLGKYL